MTSLRRTFTAAELAATANRGYGTDLTARTVYFYRSKGVLSPLEMIGSQPKFTDRHRLELKAALAMQRTLDRPSLEEVAERIRPLDDEQLELLGGAAPPTADEMITRSVLLRETPSVQGPPSCHRQLLGSPAGSLRPAAQARRTVEINSSVALRVAGDLPDEFVAGLIKCVVSYCQQHGEVFRQ